VGPVRRIAFEPELPALPAAMLGAPSNRRSMVAMPGMLTGLPERLISTSPAQAYLSGKARISARSAPRAGSAIDAIACRTSST